MLVSFGGMGELGEKKKKTEKRWRWSCGEKRRNWELEMNIFLNFSEFVSGFSCRMMQDAVMPDAPYRVYHTTTAVYTEYCVYSVYSITQSRDWIITLPKCLALGKLLIKGHLIRAVESWDWPEWFIVVLINSKGLPSLHQRTTDISALLIVLWKKKKKKNPHAPLIAASPS